MCIFCAAINGFCANLPHSIVARSLQYGVQRVSAARVFMGVYMKLLMIVSVIFMLMSCGKDVPQPSEQIVIPQEQITLPQKMKAESMLMSDSPLKPDNLDSYLFLKDCIYIDVRSPDAFYKEGHIAGFINIPFYGYIAGFPGSKTPLFEMTKKSGTYLGDSGTFAENYEESSLLIYDLFDKNKNIIVISTAGVESCYFLNLLVQLGYNPAHLYNAGSFTNGMGTDIAYRTYDGAQYLVSGIELFDTKILYSVTGLTQLK